MRTRLSVFLRQRSLLAYSMLWVVLPFFVISAGLVGAGMVIYQQSVTALIMDRDRQAATLAAAGVAEGLDSHARVLEALASNVDVLSDSSEIRRSALETAGSARSLFNSGMVVVDNQGAVRTSVPASAANVMPELADLDYLDAVRRRRLPFFSRASTSSLNGEPMVVIAVPVFDRSDAFAGALLGIARLRKSSLADLFQNILVGNNSLAYVVGQRGRVIYHHDPAQIGADFNERPSVAQVLLGRSGAVPWQTPDGERYVDGYAPVGSAGWGLVIQESWDLAAAPTQAHLLLLATLTLASTTFSIFVIWTGVRHITAPVRLIAAQTSQLAAGLALEPIRESRISEVNALGGAFNRMARQIATYRAGLRRYAGAVTRSQEEERRRISRELHDETVQSLMAIGRRIELYEVSETDPGRRAQLEALRAMMDDTVRGIRQISRDLRPLMLDDLGVVPALRALVKGAREGEGGVPQTTLNVTGTPSALSPEQELAIYRITQEALNNVRRHARAGCVSVSLSFQPDEVRLDVVDDGQGFTPPSTLAELAETGHFGLMGIQERVWAAGGALAVVSSPGHGTHVSVTIPADAAPTSG